MNKIEHWQFAEYDDDDKLIDAREHDPPNVYGFGHRGYYRNVLGVLRGEATADTDGRAGRKSLELILAIYESARTGETVPLPLKGGRSDRVPDSRTVGQSDGRLEGQGSGD